ncbi:MAG: PDZ domain-containing protein, partial [Pyrinomonadaceae bacterium]
MLKSLIPIVLFVLISAGTAIAQGTRLLRHPSVSRDMIAFSYAGDLWSVSRDGGTAKRLTATPGTETDPYFSPDGSRIAFTATFAGNTDIYVMPSAGGNPQRLTYHPAPDRVTGWTPDGRFVTFNSVRENSPQDAYFRLWKVGAAGGEPEPLPLPSAVAGSYSQSGNKFTYQEFPLMFIPQFNEISYWRHYRGGRVNPVKVIDLTNNSVEKLPWSNSNDSMPMWVGNTIYFISDRDFNANIFAYDTGSKRLTKVTNHDDFDIMNASSGADAVVYEQGGYIHLIDTKTGRSKQLDIRVTDELPMTRTQFKNAGAMIRGAALSPTGVRAAFEGRGDIFTVPAANGDYRNLTNASGSHERDPAWSPDGTQIAWLSDASGEYRMMVGDPLGLTEPRVINLPSNAYFSNLSWSPNGELMLMQDNHENLWTLDVKSGTATKADTDQYPNPFRNSFEASWSPDSKWITYSKNLKNRMLAIFVYSVAEKKVYQITDGMADSSSPAFDTGGKYLYFLASTDYGQRSGWLDMSSMDRTMKQSVYVVVLSNDEPSPFLPETGDEPLPKPASAANETAKPKSSDTSVRIDFDGIRQRVLSARVAPGDYSNLKSGTPGTFFYQELVPAIGAYRLQKFIVPANAAVPFLEGITSYTLSANNKKLLYGARGNRWGIVGTDAPAKVGDGGINVSQLEMKVDPKAEWANIFRETWRIQREFFYDPKMQGQDWDAIYKKYQPMVQYVGSREDLGYLIAQMGGELTVGHSYLSGAGDVPREDPVRVGMLGADIVIENGKYKIKRIYNGENYNPELRSPLSSPGIDIGEGDFILEVNGKPLDSTTNFYSP